MSSITISKKLPGSSANFVIKNASEMRDIANTPHRHDYYTILWSFNSEGKHMIDGDEYPFEPHRIFFIAPGQVHQVLPPNPQGLLILFNRDFFLTGIFNQHLIDKLELFSGKHTSPVAISPNKVKKMLEYANGMMDEYLAQNNHRDETIGSYLMLFLIECNRQFAQSKNMGKGLNMSKNPWVKPFIELVEANYMQWHQVWDYADQLGITSKHLSEIVKNNTGLSPKEYIQNRIVIEAKRHILFTDLSVKEIGFKLGFESPPQFSRFFKECTGLSFEEFAQSAIRR